MSTCNAIGNIVVGGTVVGMIRCTEEAGHERERVVVKGETLPELTLPLTVAEANAEGLEVIRIADPIPHSATLTWADGDLAADWPEALDPDEDFDVEVDAIDGQAVNGTVFDGDGEPR